MSKALRWGVVFLVTLALSVLGAAPVFLMGLVVNEVVTRPLTLLVMGLVAALTSNWTSNIKRGDGTHGVILPILVVSEAIAFVLYFLRIPISPNAVLLGAWGVVLSLSATLAASRYRSRVYDTKREIVMSLLLLGLAPVLVIVTVAIAARFGLTGA